MPVPEWVAKYDQAAADLERRSERRVSAPIRVLVAEAGRRLAAEYTTHVGDVNTSVPDPVRARLRAAVKRVIAALATGLISELPRVVAALDKAIKDGLRLGGGKAAVEPSDELRATLQDLRKDLLERLSVAEKLAAHGPLNQYTDVTTVLGAANQITDRAESAARWATNRAVNEGATATAGGHPRLWIALRDGCLTCLAYSGEIAQPGELFPAGRTFGNHSTVTAPLRSPPAHPNCRCRIVAYGGTDRPFAVGLPEALKREAERSVLRGDSDYASRPEKMRAADRLLTLGAPAKAGRRVPSGLPEIVKIRARRRLQAGVTAWMPAKH